MPFDEKKYRAYCVSFEERAEDEWDGMLVLLEVLWVVLLLIGLVNGFGDEPFSAGMAGAFFAVFGIVILRLRTEKRPGPKKLWVAGDVFYTEQNGQRGRAYRFSEISRVRLYYPLVAGGGRMPTLRASSVGVWQIYVEGKCVAAFSEKMNNSGRLVQKLNSMGLITPYGTGLR